MNNVDKALKQKLEPGQRQRVIKFSAVHQDYLWEINDLVPEGDARSKIIAELNAIEGRIMDAIAKEGKLGDEAGDVPVIGSASALVAAESKQTKEVKKDEKPKANPKPKKPTKAKKS